MGESMEVDHMLFASSPTKYGKKRLRQEAHFGEVQDSCGGYRHIDRTYSTFSGSREDILLDTDFHVDNCGLATMALSYHHLVWHTVEVEDKLGVGFMCCCCSSESGDASNSLSLSEIYAVEFSEAMCDQKSGSDSSLPCSKVHHFAVHAYQKSSIQKGTWIPKSYTFQHPDPAVCKKWSSQIQCLIDEDKKRPKALLVIINPFSGKKTALKTWEEVSTLFIRAKINTKVLRTERIRHAFDIMNTASDAELEELDGVVVVGGDGLFNEVLNGLLVRRHGARYPSKPQDVQKAHQGNSHLGQSRDCKLESEKRENGQTSTELAEANEEVDTVTLPVSADLHPLLEDSTEEDTISTRSNTASTYSLLCGSENDDNGSFKMTESSSFAAARTCGSDFSNSNESIQFKEGGFIIPSLGSTCRPGSVSPISGFVFPNPKFRLGIIPAGSTDSIAVSTTGSRNPATSALHIILGESMPLDIVRLVSWSSRCGATGEHPRVRYAASFAGYGFYGDVIKESEPSRWMGPLRYDYAGTKVFLQHRLYEAEVSYIDLPESMTSTVSVHSHSNAEALWQRKMQNTGLSRMTCRVNCGICAKGVDYFDSIETSIPLISPQREPKWKHLRGLFISVGAAVISCRNDKAPNGIAATAHLADGLLHLILVKECSRLAYLWHLIQLTKEGSNPLDFIFVEEYRTPQFNFISYGEESIWNVDGELFPAHQLSAQVFRGLVNIFAAGPDV